jgi:hypothetical protein
MVLFDDRSKQAMLAEQDAVARWRNCEHIQSRPCTAGRLAAHERATERFARIDCQM